MTAEKDGTQEHAKKSLNAAYIGIGVAIIAVLIAALSIPEVREFVCQVSGVLCRIYPGEARVFVWDNPQFGPGAVLPEFGDESGSIFCPPASERQYSPNNTFGRGGAGRSIFWELPLSYTQSEKEIDLRITCVSKGPSTAFQGDGTVTTAFETKLKAGTAGTVICGNLGRTYAWPAGYYQIDLLVGGAGKVTTQFYLE